MTPLPSRWADARQARLLLNHDLRPALDALIRAPLSASELAGRLGLSVQRAHHLLTRLIQAEVAEVASVEPRAGRPIRRYRVHGDWYVPFEVTEAATLTELVQGQLTPRVNQVLLHMVEALYGWRETWGLRLSHAPDEERGISLQLIGPDGTSPFDGPPMLALLAGLSLSPGTARDLRDRLLALLDEFEAKQEPGARPHTVGLFFTAGEVP